MISKTFIIIFQLHNIERCVVEHLVNVLKLTEVSLNQLLPNQHFAAT